MDTISDPAPQQTLFFIPDISGFTKFVHDTEISHSQHIIEELLELLVDANEIGLIVSEIEGDAVLFYRGGQAPTAAELLAQVQRMYVRFHAHLRRYEALRICQCGACRTANDLTLKFIVHYGEVGKNQVKEHRKLFGRDVIVAHRLMKNEVPCQEYVLLTHQLLNACSNWVQLKEAVWSPPESHEEAYDFGTVAYCYIDLAPLQAHVPAPTVEDYSLPGVTVEVMRIESVIEAPLELVFDVVTDLSRRHNWIVGLQGSDRHNGRITRNGSTHRCIVKDQEDDPFYVTHAFEVGDDLVTFTDTNQRDGMCNVYILRRLAEKVTRLEVHTFMEQKLLKLAFFRLFMKRQYSQIVRHSHENLKAYCKELSVAGKAAPAGVLLRPAALPTDAVAEA